MLEFAKVEAPVGVARDGGCENKLGITLKIQTLDITGVGGVASLHLEFNPQMNIICGPNGIGKTTVLESVAHCFMQGRSNLLKRHVGSENGRIDAKLAHNGKFIPVVLQFTQYEPTQDARVSGVDQQYASYLISLKINRSLPYVPLAAVSRDQAKPLHTLWEDSKDGVKLHDIKNWFVNRYLYSAHHGSLSSEQLSNLDLAKKCFSALSRDFSFATVQASSNEILVKTPSGQIYYEYLSSGFKSCLAILFAIIKEVEYRFPATMAGDFEGIILIDEIEMHLHPQWQSRISEVLLEIFPAAQFIVTTHSPHVIQSAEPNHIIALESNAGVVVKRELPSSSYGFKGWTLDEVLTDVMGMTDTRTAVFNKLMDDFGRAIDAEDREAAHCAFEKLDLSLHPSNVTRKLLRLQLAGIGGGIDKA